MNHIPPKELVIGDVHIPGALLLGPMAGVTDLPFRLLCHEMGAGMVCMEMVSAKAITYHNKNTAALMEIHEDEHPAALQLFGSEPEVMAEATQMIADRPYDILDINMGCPVPKVFGNGEGSALMKDPRRIEDIVRAVSAATDRPVTVKLRRGVDEAHVNAVECALAAEAGGAKAVAIHGRTRQQFYTGKADWTTIREVKQALKIPVIGNGDVTDGRSALDLFNQTGCDGIMIARAARGNPWIFREVRAALEQGSAAEVERPDAQELYDMVMRHARLQVQYKGEYMGMRQMRSHAAWYTAGYPNSARLRERLSQMEHLEELEAAMRELFLEGNADRN